MMAGSHSDYMGGDARVKMQACDSGSNQLEPDTYLASRVRTIMNQREAVLHLANRISLLADRLVGSQPPPPPSTAGSIALPCQGVVGEIAEALEMLQMAIDRAHEQMGRFDGLA